MRTEQFQWSMDSGWEPRLSSGPEGGAVQMVLVFFSPQAADCTEWYEQVRAAYPQAHLIGCTTSGQIQGGSVRERSVVVTAVAFDNTSVRIASAPITGPDCGYEAGQELARSLSGEGLNAVLLIADGLKTNATETVEGMNSVLPAGYACSEGAPPTVTTSGTHG